MRGNRGRLRRWLRWDCCRKIGWKSWWLSGRLITRTRTRTLWGLCTRLISWLIRWKDCWLRRWVERWFMSRSFTRLRWGEGTWTHTRINRRLTNWHTWRILTRLRSRWYGRFSWWYIPWGRARESWWIGRRKLRWNFEWAISWHHTRNCRRKKSRVYTRISRWNWWRISSWFRGRLMWGFHRRMWDGLKTRLRWRSR